MSKKVCICGTERGKEKPLVITITTCKNRHSHEEAKPKCKPKPKALCEPCKPKALCEPCKPKALCDPCCEPPDVTPCTGSCSSLSTVKSSKKKSKTCCKQSDSCTIDNLRYSSDDACPGPGPKGCGEPVSQMSCCECGKKKKKEKKKSDCEKCCKPAKKKDKSYNCPSGEVRLPTLVPRYHGPGCAMEVDVLEKHDKNCRMKKQKNPKRGKDDRSGSYEVIGRIIFKTCQPPPCPKTCPGPEPPPCKSCYQPKDSVCSKPCCPQKAKLACIYSLFNIPQGYRETCDVDLDAKTNKERIRFLQKYLKHQKVLENLAKSSKSFPTNLNKYDVMMETTECDNSRRHYSKKQNYEVEEIYVSDTRSNQSIQMVERTPERSKHKIRKWMYFFFPCFYSYDSTSSLGCSDVDMEYKNRRYEYMV